MVSVMPKDEWKRANDRARYGEVRRIDPPKPSAARKRRASKRLKKVRDKYRISKRWSASSKLWFGMHRDKCISDVPVHYLRWLVTSTKPGEFWRMDGLVMFLKKYLAKLESTEFIYRP